MPDRLRGKVACISGIGRGQGRAGALLFAGEGARVVACDVNAEEAEATVREARENGGEVDLVMGDARIEQDVARWIGHAAEACGGIDVLYNNAAFTQFGPVHEMKLEEWQAAIQGELDEVFLGCKYAIPHMIPWSLYANL